MVVRISELARAQDDAIRVNALWVIKNLLNKASTEEKYAVMNNFGWDYLRSCVLTLLLLIEVNNTQRQRLLFIYLYRCLVDAKEDIQEQALVIVENIASSPEDIMLLLNDIPSEELLKIIADALESSSEEVVCQVRSFLWMKIELSIDSAKLNRVTFMHTGNKSSEQRLK